MMRAGPAPSPWRTSSPSSSAAALFPGAPPRAWPDDPGAPPAQGVAPRHALGHALTRSLGRPLVSGNRIELLGAERAGPAVSQAVAQAHSHVNLEACGPGAPDAALAALLALRSRAGVRVNLLCDADAAGPLEALRRAGVTVSGPRRLDRLRQRLGSALGLREQHRLLVIDGRIGFVGALAGDGSGASVLRLEGPIVAELQRLFMRQWQRLACEPMRRGSYVAPLGLAGTQRAGLAAQDAGAGRNRFLAALLAAVESAQQRVLLRSDGALPLQRLLGVLADAARRGVEVRMLVPPAELRRYTGRAPERRLLQAGVHLHEAIDAQPQPRCCVIDGVWASVGAGRLDWRGLVWSAEANVVVLDHEFGQQVERQFWSEVAASRTVAPSGFGGAADALMH